VQVAVRRDGLDVEFLASVGAVAVPDQAQLLEDVEGPVHGRGDRRRIDLPAALNQLGARDVPVRA